jgi:hypothetical protein
LEVHSDENSSQRIGWTEDPASASARERQLEAGKRAWREAIHWMLIAAPGVVGMAILIRTLAPQQRWLLIGITTLVVIPFFCMAKFIVYSAHREMEKERGPYDGKRIIR